MFRFRLSDAAQNDVLGILGWTHEQFGESARLRYEALIVAALRDVAAKKCMPPWWIEWEGTQGRGVKEEVQHGRPGRVGRGTAPALGTRPLDLVAPPKKER